MSEIAQIEIADVLLPSGRLREEMSLRGAITKGSKVRCVYLSHPKTVAALARYIEGRWKHAKVTALERSKWRNLCQTILSSGFSSMLDCCPRWGYKGGSDFDR
ncbi:hypothetical protein [Burkholderia pyrrocinia]|uniref:hypothetical protein n=1 Tax=Burkholderia pyrrocinia TaxID=60550 RepID=UPI003083C4B7